MLTGLLIGILLTVCASLLFDKFRKKEIVDKPHEIVDERTDEEIEKEKVFLDHFSNMMNYNPAKAYGRSKI